MAVFTRAAVTRSQRPGRLASCSPLAASTRQPPRWQAGVAAYAPAGGLQVLGQVLAHQRRVVGVQHQLRRAAQGRLGLQQFAHHGQDGAGVQRQGLAQHLARDVQRQGQQVVGNLVFGAAQRGRQRQGQRAQLRGFRMDFGHGLVAALRLAALITLAKAFGLAGLQGLQAQLGQLDVVDQHLGLERCDHGRRFGFGGSAGAASDSCAMAVISQRSQAVSASLAPLARRA